MWCKSGFCVFIFILTFNQFHVEAQNPCRTPNSERASCVSIYNCRHLLDAIQTRDPVQLQFLRLSRCGYTNVPLVCCGSRSNYVNQNSNQDEFGGRRIFGNDNQISNGNGNGNVERNPLIPDRGSCGHDFSDKIFGGEATQVNELPWTVLLQYDNGSGRRRWACAGTLINNRYVLTAAHCVTGDILTKVGRLVNVRLGEYDTDNEVDCQGRLCNSPIDVGVDQTLHHEGYRNNNKHRYNDIALVRLNREVKFTPFIQPICLPQPNEAANVGDLMTAAGWGKTEYSSRSSIKLKVEVPIAERSQCTREFASAGINLRSSQICAGGQRGKDSCTGDSGGPLMKTVNGDSSTWYQEGIVSFGARCGTEGWPAIYTKVGSFLDWINRNVRE